MATRLHQNIVKPINKGTTTITPPSSAIVGGRLSQYYLSWTTISTDDWLIQTLKNGYRILFLTTPPLRSTRSPIVPFNRQQQQLLQQEIDSLLQKQPIEPVEDPYTTPGFYSNMFVIPKKTGGHRPVFNLKRLNSFIEAPHFKMETLNSSPKFGKSTNDIKDYIHGPP